MTPTAGEIERWDAEDLRAVAEAADRRALAVFEAAAGLAPPGGWDGAAAQAAVAAIGRTREELYLHGQEVLALAAAARRGADGVEALTADLARIKVEAVVSGWDVDPSTSRIVWRPGARRRETGRIPRDLQRRLDALVQHADSLDLELAAALGLRDGPVPGADLEVRRALDGPLPEDPARFHDLWQRLSNTDRDKLYRRDPGIGNHPGMPAGDERSFGSDHYNRLHLADQLAAAQAAGTENLADLQALDAALDENLGTRLLLFDPTGGRQVHAAVAVGDPDTAEHVSVTAPGLNTTVAGSIGTMVSEAGRLRRHARDQLARTDARAGEDVAAIAWIGYDPPQVSGLPDIVGSQRGMYQVSHDGGAKAGAARLARFYDGIAAARGGTPMHLTAIGHSYGSLTTGLALQRPGGHPVDAAIFYGSPGVAASTPEQLNLPTGRVFVMQTPDDPIGWTRRGPAVLRAVGAAMPGSWAQLLIAGADATGTGQFGPSPATNPNFVRLETGPTTVTDGRGGVLNLDGAGGHSEYARRAETIGPDGLDLPRTSGYNIAAVVAGLEGNVIRGD